MYIQILHITDRKGSSAFVTVYWIGSLSQIIPTPQLECKTNGHCAPSVKIDTKHIIHHVVCMCVLLSFAAKPVF